MISLRSFLFLPLLLAGSLCAADTPPAVAVVSPTRGDVHRFITLPGSLRANQQVTLYAKVAGYLKSIAVDKGDKVQAGQLLAQLEMPETLAEQARHEAEVKVAQAEMARLRVAREKAPDLITPQALDAAEGRLAMAQAALTGANSLLAYSNLTAPFAGVVTMRYADAGAFVPAASASSNPAAAAILTVMDISTVRATVAVPEIEAARIQVGQPVIVTTDGLLGRSFKGTVSRHSYALDEATRSVSVEADLANADGVLRPGMYVLIRLGIEQHQNVRLIPAAALIKEKTAHYVFVFADGKANRVSVKVGFNDGANVEITDGLAEDARVILPGKLTLVSGQAVTVQEAR